VEDRVPLYEGLSLTSASRPVLQCLSFRASRSFLSSLLSFIFFLSKRISPWGASFTFFLGVAFRGVVYFVSALNQ